VGDFHELTGDLTREQLNGDAYWRGIDVGRAARERYPRSWPQKLARSIGVHAWSCGRHALGRAHLGDSGLTRDGVLVYGRDYRPFDIFVYAALDHEVKARAVVLLLGLALVSTPCGDREGEAVRSDCVSELFAEGFADGFLRGDVCDWAELELAMRLSADVRSRVKAALAGGGASRAQRDAVSRGGVPVLVAGSAGSGKSVELVDDTPTGSQFARPDMVLSLNGRTVEVYNPDGAPLSTIVDGRGVSLVNEATGERVGIPDLASHVFFVDGGVWFHYPNWGEPDLVFDDGWAVRAWLSTACYRCGAPVDVDGDLCDACEDKDYQEWASFGCDW
jgi:hypothetical protein